MLAIKLETPRRLQNKPDELKKFSRGAAIIIARGVGGAVRQRVQVEGQPTESYRGPSKTHRALISPRYPGGEAGTPTPSGARAFKSHMALHAALGAKSGSFSPSGGMWAGLSTVSRTAAEAVDIFRGRSEGQDPNFFTYKSGKVKARGAKPTNALKAGTIFASTGINVLALTPAEMSAVAGAVQVELVSRAIEVIGFDVPSRGSPTSSEALFRVLREMFRAS